MISILVPCYNDNHVVGKAIQSCLNQSFDNYEIIVIDDGSDTPLRVPESDRVRLVRHRKNKGLSEALNSGVRNSRGTHLCICSADDEIHTDYLSSLYPYTDRVDIVSCDFVAGGRHVRCGPGSLDRLIDGNVHSYAALFSREVFDKNGGFKWYMNPSWEDWEFWLNAAKHGAKWHHVSYPYHKYNRNPTGRDADSQDKGNLLKGKLHGAHQDIYGKGAGAVTFIIPCYKHEEWVNNAIRSCYDQLYPHINVVVVNDGSMKPRKFSSIIDDDRAVIVNQRNKGLSAARNTGIKKAIDYYNSEYLIMLDADDEVDPYYVENCMMRISSEYKEYIYTDVQFIGDADHKYTCDDYNCHVLTKKHIHACTFLSRSFMYKDLISKRGYAYDESMKKGYEDWEFALAVLKNGWCGKKLPGYYFKYRYHVNGSMRTEASKINNELVSVVRGKQPWVSNNEAIDNMCRSCGGGSGRYTHTVMKGSAMNTIVSIPGIGEVDGDTPIEVTYSGSTTSTMTKVGPSGTVYKYSGNMEGTATFPNKFPAFAKDYNVFSGPQFAVKLIELAVKAIEPIIAEQVVLVHKPVVKPVVVDPHKISKTAAQLVVEETTEQKIVEKLPDKVDEYPHDDFIVISGIGPERSKALHSNNIHYYEDIIDMNARNLAAMISVGVSEANAIIKFAEAELEKLM